MTSKHILIVTKGIRHYGMFRVVSYLSLAWAKTHEVSIAAFDGRNQAYPLGGKIYDLKAPMPENIPMRFWRACQITIGLVALIHKTRPDYLIGFGDYANLRLLLAALVTGNLSRTIVSVHVSLIGGATFRVRALIRVLYRLPKRIITVSHEIKMQLIALGIPEAKIDFIPNSAPVVPASPIPRPKFKGKYILAVGKLVKRKGFDMLLLAYTRLAKNAPDLVILGEGSERQNLTRLAISLGISKKLHLIGEVDNPEDWYAHAELFVLSSQFEGWPLVIPEAMAHGCPVVSFDCPTGPAEIIAHGKNGVLVANGDVKALTKAMAKVLGDGKLRQQLGKAGQARAKEFGVTKLAPLWLALGE